MIRLVLTAGALFALGCDTPHTTVTIENAYAPDSAQIVYRAFWQAVSFPDPIAPGSASDPADTVAASPNTAYALVAPGWDPASDAPPTSFLVLQSRSGFEVHLDQALLIPVDDATFAGNCAAGAPLSQADADFITGRVFAEVFAGLRYDAATCTTSAAP